MAPVASTFAIRRILPHEGPRLRAARLSALADQPGEATTNLARSRALGDDHWADAASANASGGSQATFFADAVADPDGPAVGLIGAYANRDGVVNLVALWSGPGFRDIGVAEALLDAVAEWSRDSGASRVRRWVLERNEHTRAFYERYGFAATGAEMPFEPQPSINQLEMVLDL
jgi:GNAT superfamily N-acetyltransferase